jgi:hypothetical protein
MRQISRLFTETLANLIVIGGGDCTPDVYATTFQVVEDFGMLGDFIYGVRPA